MYEVQYRTKYTNFDVNGNNAPFTVLITNMTTNKSWKVPAILVEPSANTLDAEAVFSDIDAAVVDTDYLVQIIAHESSADTTGVLVPTPMTSFTVKGIVFVNGITISYAPPLALPDRTLDLSASETHRQMTLVFSGSSAPTFKSGTWTSSDSDIAYVGADGQIIPTNNKLGDVYFTFTADDGGGADPVTSNVKTVRSETFTVVAGSVPALVLPGEANTIFTQQNDSVQVRWSSNAKFFGSNTTFNYTIELFAGNFTGEQLGAHSPVYTTTATSDKNNVIIPGEQFPGLSVGGAPAYTVRISMPHPIAATETLETVGYVVVRPKPAVAHVTPPADGLYILDGAATPIRWTVENYIDDETEGTLRVDRIRTENGADVTENIVSQPVTVGGGTYSLEPAAVQGLKDTYMVSLQVRNSTNTGYSSDSFPLYVYNSASLQLEIDGVKVGNTFAMDNEPAVRGTLPTETKNILALREELTLIEYIGINYGDYDWSQLKDGIRWSTTDTSTLSINYRQGGLYENIARFSMSTYFPETKMAISSVTDGTATISATHANTGMSDSVTVSIKTLREKFYLFQLSPALRTELQYTDGTGKSKTVYTNDEGVLALYEPNRIASDIGLRASGSDNSIWLGTLYKSNLQSGERDATLLQLYPLNSFKLRQAAKAEIFLKNPDGSPFSGTLKMSGGVYKNDGYCEMAAMLGNTVPNSSNPLIDGKSEQNVTIGANGKLTVYMDSTQFWSAAKGENNGGGLNLQPRDRLQYVFVLKPSGNYRPCLIYVDGNLTPDDLMRSAESIVTLDANIGAAQSFIANQTIDYGLSGNRLIDVRNAPTHIGPNETYREIKLLTTVLLWGESGATANYNLTMTDEFGYVPSNQKSEFIRYPFSDIMVVRNSLTLSKAAITDSGWIVKGKDAGLRARLSREATMLRDMSVLPRVTDLTDSPKLTESGEISGIIVDLQASSGTPSAYMSGTGDIIIGKLMGFLGNMSGPVDSSVFKMIITPSESNTSFHAFIWGGIDSLGMQDVDYTQTGLFVDTKLAESKLNVAPGLGAMTDMAKGNYEKSKLEKKIDDSIANQPDGKIRSSADIGAQLQGYFEASIDYNFEKSKWEITVLGGGFTAGFKLGVNLNVNTQVGPVPLPFSLAVGGAIQLDFKAAVRFGELSGLPWASAITADTVNDYMTTLRINAYVNAFGGFGYDYSVLSLKIGLFGKLTVDSQNRFLSRPYLADSAKRQINGQGLAVSGEVGLKAVAKFLFISYECVLASVKGSGKWTFNSWDAINSYWKEYGTGVSLMGTTFSPQGALTPISSSATLQSRDYLDRFSRSWGLEGRTATLFALDDPSTVSALQSNAYPYSFPLLSNDGSLMLYASDGSSADVSETRIYSTMWDGGKYPEGSKIQAPAGFEGYGDSDLSVDGNVSLTVAAWVRQNATLPEKAGEKLTLEEQAILMNSTEIVASVYQNAAWSSTRLTDNAGPDLAPVAATNGSDAIVAWRSVYAANAENITDFSQQDFILYSFYDAETDSWSDPAQFYNGTSGAVKGITAAMLADGTAAVAYTLDTNPADNSSADYEVGYGIVAKASEADAADDVFSAIITQDAWADENPQIAAVKYEEGDERFILAWHSIRENIGDIRLAAINNEGLLSNSFIESLAQAASGSGVDINGNFRLAKMNGSNNAVGNLSILWSQTMTNEAGESDYGVLRAVKLVGSGNDIRLSAALDVAALGARTLLDHFDAYVASSDGKTVKALIQGVEYKEIVASNSSTYESYTDFEGNEYMVPLEETKLFTATAVYENSVTLNSLGVDYENLALNTLNPIVFTVFNAGIDPISSVVIDIGGEGTTFGDLALNPNESTDLVYWHHVGSVVENLDYTLTAIFTTGDDTLAGKVYLDYPDLGISQMEIISEELGVRTMQITLYNAFAANYSGGKSRSVKLGFYDDAMFANIQSVTCGTSGVAIGPDKILTISDEAALKMIDDGALTLEVSFDVGDYVAAAALTEIPEAGIRLFANA